MKDDDWPVEKPHDINIAAREPVEVLVVDDERLNQLSVEAALRSLDVRILRAFNGKEALAALRAHDVALVLLDIMMPGMDGFAVAEYMRANPATEDIPIIFVTAMSGERRLELMGYEKGAVDYLNKPVEPSILRKKAAFFIDVYRNKRRLERRIENLEKTLHDKK